MTEPMEDIKPPDPRQELVEACRDGECVLYVGAGLSAQVGYPTWQTFVRGLLDWAVKSELFDPGFADSLRDAIREGDVDPVADNVVSVVAEEDPKALQEYLRGVFLRPRPVSKVHNVLQQIPFSAVLTTNFDNCLEQTFPGAPVYTPGQTEPLLDAIVKRQFFLLKLYGTLEQPESVMVAPAQYDAAINGNLPFAQFMETLFFSRTLLFVGASLEGIEAYLRGIALPTGIRRTHYALVGVKGRAWEAKASLHRRRYGIQALPFTPSKGFPEILPFLISLRDRVDAARRRSGEATGGRTSTAQDETQPSPLRRIVLENIGPFEQLDLELDPRWNILLGDNGVGKSNILKALATAIAGRDAEAYADRLIRVFGNDASLAPSSSITLVTDRNTYKTVIRSRSNQKADLQSIPGRPLEAEGWLAIGFPPLRTVSWDRPKAPETFSRSRPVPEDLLPLVRGTPDPRLDKLKQWIVNLDYWIKDERSRTGQDGIYGKLLREFFRVVADLTEGIQIDFVEVRPQTNEVIVRTDDGDLPLEALSQGTISLMGWVGILLQRLFEIYSDDEDPTRRYALVLMDEIDAHLHPRWQQVVVGKLGKLFPNVQFIATTHSPLIVGGMTPNQVFRFARDEDGKVVRLPVEAEMIVGRADQLLTGDLFGLGTTIDSATQEKMGRYAALLGKSLRSEEEDQEFQRLQGILQARIPMSGETPVARRAQELLKSLLRVQAGNLFPETQAALLGAAERLFSSLQKQSEQEKAS